MRFVLVLFAISTLAACDQQYGGYAPVGGGEPEPAELSRFVRRLHLDLTGTPASDEYVQSSVKTLAADGDWRARAALAEALVSSEQFAELYVAELSNRTFAGESIADRYALICNVVRGSNPACTGCAASADPCESCDCALITELREERDALFSAAADLAEGAATGEIDRRFAAATGFRLSFGNPATVANALFELALGRPAEPEQLENAQAMVIGAFPDPNAPAGLLFHRHGKSYDELIDIIFESEAYRDAAVEAVFLRYLGRLVKPGERAHFSASLDPAAPDVRDVIVSVTSSQEYFEQ